MSTASITTFAGIATTGYAASLNINDDTNVKTWSKFGRVDFDVNGASGEYWVKLLKVADGAPPPPAASDPRPSGGALYQADGWFQIKSGETKSVGTLSSKGYDPQMHGQNYYTHVQIYCTNPGTNTATQLRIFAQ